MTDGAHSSGAGNQPATVGIRALADLCLQAGVEEIEAATGPWSVHMKLDLSATAAEVLSATDDEPAEPDAPHVLMSQWVGVFHRSPDAGAPAFVQESQLVEAGEIVGVVAAMQIQHEVLADRAGVLRRFLIQDRTAVEYGQPLLEIE